MVKVEPPSVSIQKYSRSNGVSNRGDIHTFLDMRAKYNQYNRGEAGGLNLDFEYKIKDMLKRFPELGKLPYKTVPLQPSQVNTELEVGEIKPLTAIDGYLIKECPKVVGTMIYIAITSRPVLPTLLVNYLVECISPTSFIAICSRTPLAICETQYTFHFVILASHRKSLICLHN